MSKPAARPPAPDFGVDLDAALKRVPAARGERRRAAAALKHARAEGWAGWVRTVADLRAMADPELACAFDLAAAERAWKFFARVLRVKNPKGGLDTVPFVLFDWQYFDVVGPLMGWKRADGTRRFRTADVWVPKKNGKTPLAAGLTLMLLVADGEAEPSLYGFATTREQAKLLYKDAANMVQWSPVLSEKLVCSDYRSTIAVIGRERDHIYKAMPADDAPADGIRAHAVVLDELHRQKSRRLVDVLKYAFAAHPQPINLTISTAGDEFESIGYERYKLAEQIFKGDVYDPTHLVFIAAADPEDDWTDPATWAKANPSWGQTIKPQEMAEACRSAQQNPAEAANFKRLRLNLWVGRHAGFIDMPTWREQPVAEGAAPAGDPAEAERLRGLPCWGGLDLSSTRDLTAFALKFDHDDGARSFRGRAWLPEARLALREKRDGVPYRAWAEAGWLELTEGDVIDHDRIVAQVLADAETYGVRQVAYDPNWGGDRVAVQLEAGGVEMYAFRQSKRMMTPVLSELDRLLGARLVDHGDNPLLAWCAANLEVLTSSDGLMIPIKPKETGRIDPIVALLMALGSDLRVDDDGDSVYETTEREGGLLTL